MNKRHRIKWLKVVIVAFVTIIVFLVAFIIFRGIYIKNRFAPFLDVVEDETLSIRYDEKYDCGVALPKGLTRLRGNLYVSPFRYIIKDDSTGETYVDERAICDLIIYVDFPTGYTVLATIRKGEHSIDVGALKLDERMQPLFENEIQLEAYNMYYDVILDSYKVARAVFNVLNPPG